MRKGQTDRDPKDPKSGKKAKGSRPDQQHPTTTTPKPAEAPSQSKKQAPSQKNGSILVGPETLQTSVGPVHEWLALPENLPAHPTIAAFGKRRTGKSTSITNLLFHCCRHIPFGLVMSDTAYAGYWEKLVPKRHIIQGLRQDVLEWLIARQTVGVEKYGVKVSPLFLRQGGSCRHTRTGVSQQWHTTSPAQPLRA